VVGGQRQAALEELHDRHASELWRFAMRLTHDRQLSEDVVQEVLLKAWKDPSLGQRDEAAARAWLFTASRN
jgi:RNA polymerase sigma-70 factor (ECF subfamily)